MIGTIKILMFVPMAFALVFIYSALMLTVIIQKAIYKRLTFTMNGSVYLKNGKKTTTSPTRLTIHTIVIVCVTYVRSAIPKSIIRIYTVILDDIFSCFLPFVVSIFYSIVPLVMKLLL